MSEEKWIIGKVVSTDQIPHSRHRRRCYEAIYAEVDKLPVGKALPVEMSDIKAAKQLQSSFLGRRETRRTPKHKRPFSTSVRGSTVWFVRMSRHE